MRTTLRPLLALAAAAAACSTAPEETPTRDGPVHENVFMVMSVDELMEIAQREALVPSPIEMQKALTRAGLEDQLAALVPDRADLKMDVPYPDQVAVRTGVVLADLLLTLKAAPKDELVAHLAKIKTGMVQLGGGEDIPATIDDLSARIQNDAVSRDDLVKELDELSGVMIPEIEYEAGEQVVPLIQAGSWLEGANLIAGSMIAAGDYSAADELLKQPTVIEYFQGYVAGEGAKKAPSDVLAELDRTLAALAEIAAEDALGEPEVREVQRATAAVLDLL